MKTLRRSILVLLTVVLLSAIAVLPTAASTPAAVQAGDILDITGIGTDELEFFSFYYADVTGGQNPLDIMKPLTRVVKGAANGSWPFNVDFKLYSYENESWPTGVTGRRQAIFFPKDDPSIMFVGAGDLLELGADVHSIIVFTAPATGNYTLSFDGSVSWSPDSMEMDTYVNGTKNGSTFVFSNVVNDPASGSPANYTLTTDLNAGEQICLVFSNNAGSINRVNVQNLQVEVNSCENSGNSGNNGGNTDNNTGNNTGNNNTGNNTGNNGGNNTGNNNTGNNTGNNSNGVPTVSTKNLIAVLLITTDFLVGFATGAVVGAIILAVVLLTIKAVKKKK